jgi:lysozyme family protein
MTPHIENLIRGIINREGGYVNHAADKGGPTKYGITIGTLTGWRHKKCIVQDVKDLTINEAFDIYYHQYVVAPGFIHLEEPLLSQVIDAGVNHGAFAATCMLQRALGLSTIDGIIGPVTKEAIANEPSIQLAIQFLAERLLYFGKILEQSNKQYPLNPKDQRVFAAGWFNRMGNVAKLI